MAATSAVGDLQAHGARAVFAKGFHRGSIPSEEVITKQEEVTPFHYQEVVAEWVATQGEDQGDCASGYQRVAVWSYQIFVDGGVARASAHCGVGG